MAGMKTCEMVTLHSNGVRKDKKTTIHLLHIHVCGADVGNILVFLFHQCSVGWAAFSKWSLGERAK